MCVFRFVIPFHFLAAAIFILPAPHALGIIQFSQQEVDRIMQTLCNRYYTSLSPESFKNDISASYYSDTFASLERLMSKYVTTLRSGNSIHANYGNSSSEYPVFGLASDYKKTGHKLLETWNILPYLQAENNIVQFRHRTATQRENRGKFTGKIPHAQRVSPLLFFDHKTHETFHDIYESVPDDKYFRKLFRLDDDHKKTRKSLRYLDIWQSGNHYEQFKKLPEVEISTLTEAVCFFQNHLFHMNAYPPYRETLSKLATPFHRNLFHLLKTHKATSIAISTLDKSEKTALRAIFINPFQKNEIHKFSQGLKKAKMLFPKENNTFYGLRLVMNHLPERTPAQIPRFRYNAYFFLDTGGYSTDFGMEKVRHYQIIWIAFQNDRLLLGMYPTDGMLLVYSIDNENQKSFFTQFAGLLGHTQEYHVSGITQSILQHANSYAKQKLYQRILKSVFLYFQPLDDCNEHQDW